MVIINNDFINFKINEFISDLVDRCPNIKEIWLIGSRASGMERPDSDWDLLIFVNDNGITLRRVSDNTGLKNRALERKDPINPLIHNKNDDFIHPWPKPGRKDKLNLNDINWNVWGNPDAAEYEAEHGTGLGRRIWKKGIRGRT